MESTIDQIKTLLGRFSSGKKIVFQLNLSHQKLGEFVSFLTDQEKIELFCLAEFHVYTRTINQEKSLDLPSLLSLEDYLKKIVYDERLAPSLVSMGLRTSIDRLNLGRSLALSKS